MSIHILVIKIKNSFLKIFSFFIINEVYSKYTMEITTVKLYAKTKGELDLFKTKKETYDEVIKRLLAEVKQRDITKKLIEGYKKMGKEELEILKEWDFTSSEVD